VLRPFFLKATQLTGVALRGRSTRSVLALGVGVAAGRGSRLVRNMILARLLAPESFGMMAIIMMAAMALEAVTEVGIKQSVIQNKGGADPNYLNVAWWFQAIRGALLFVLAFLAAPWVSSFYGQPELMRLLQVAFVAVVFKGLVSPRAYVLEKEYKFGWAVFLTQGSAVCGTLVTIGIALVAPNVWALVIGYVAESFILFLLSYVIVPFLPRLEIDRHSLRELAAFARGMFGLSVFAMISFQADILVLGKTVSGEQLGMYSLAANLAYLPIDLFLRTINPVLLPGFSQRQDDKDSLLRLALLVTRWTAVLTVPLGILMCCSAGAILRLAYGPVYVAAAVPFALLGLSVVARTEAGVLSTVYLAVGRPHLHRRFVVLRAVIILALMYPASLYYGTIGAAATMTLSGFIPLLMQVRWSQKVVSLTARQYFRCYITGVLFAFLVVAVFILSLCTGMRSSTNKLIISCVALAVVYTAYLARAFARRSDRSRTKESSDAIPTIDSAV